MKTIQERLKAKGITEKSKFHNYDYLYKSIVEVMQDYEKKLNEKEVELNLFRGFKAQMDYIIEENTKNFYKK